MKLILAIVNNEDSAIVASALTHDGFTVTKLSTTGGFLQVGNTTFLIGTDDDKVQEVKSVISKYCATRKRVNPSTASFGKGISNNSVPTEVVVGGATVFVLGVEDCEKL